MADAICHHSGVEKQHEPVCVRLKDRCRAVYVFQGGVELARLVNSSMYAVARTPE